MKATAKITLGFSLGFLLQGEKGEESWSTTASCLNRFWVGPWLKRVLWPLCLLWPVTLANLFRLLVLGLLLQMPLLHFLIFHSFSHLLKNSRYFAVTFYQTWFSQNLYVLFSILWKSSLLLFSFCFVQQQTLMLVTLKAIHLYTTVCPQKMHTHFNSW